MSDLVGLLDLIAPFFGLIAIGFVCAKFVNLEKGGLAWMQFFLIYIALPCLFFRLIADKPLDELTNWPYVIPGTTPRDLLRLLRSSFTAGWWFTRDNAPGCDAGSGGLLFRISAIWGRHSSLRRIRPAAMRPVRPWKSSYSTICCCFRLFPTA